MNLRKKMISVGLVAAMTAACIHGSSFEMRKVSQDQAQSDATLTGSKFSRDAALYFWYTDEGLSDYINHAAVAFGEQENVHILPVLVEDREFLEAVYEASINDHQMPDLFLLGNESIEKAYLAGLLADVSSSMRKSGSYSKAAIDAVTYHEKQVGFPFFFETSVLVYNDDYLKIWAKQQADSIVLAYRGDVENPAITEWIADENDDGEIGHLEQIRAAYASEFAEQITAADASSLQTVTQELTDAFYEVAIPKTLEQVLEFADSFDVPEGVEAICEWDVSDILYNYWIGGSAFDICSDTGDSKTEVSVNNESAIAAMQAYQDLHQFFSIDSSACSYEGCIRNFLDGKTVFTVGGCDLVERLEAYGAKGGSQQDTSQQDISQQDASRQDISQQDANHFSCGFAVLPSITEGVDTRSMSITQLVAVNGFSTQKDLASKFAAYLTVDYADQLYPRAKKLGAGVLPRESYKIGASMDVTAYLIEYEQSIPLPKLMQTENLWMQLEALFSGIWNGEDVPTELEKLEETLRLQLN